MPRRLTTVTTGATDPIRYYRSPIVGPLFRRRIEMGLEMIGTLPGESRVLEVGYAAGVVLYNLRDKGAALYGIDIDADPTPVERRLAELGVPAHLSQGSVLDMRDLYPDDWFDAVVAFSVLEHIRETDQVLAELHRVLKPGGVALIGMPAVNSFMEWAFLAIGFKGIADHHVTTPSRVWRRAKLRPDRWRAKRRALPGWVPFGLALYHAFRFVKVPPR